VIQRLRTFGLLLQDMPVLRSKRGMQIKENLMRRLDHVDLFAQKRVIEKKIKCPRAETRTNCDVHMGLILDQ
jgi:hypothetical protein